MSKKYTFKPGDLIVCTAEGCTGGGYRTGETYEVKSSYWSGDDLERVMTVKDSFSSTTNGWVAENFKLKYSENPRSFAHTFSPGGQPTVLGTQVGGSHYTDCAIQPIEYIWANKLGFSEGNIVKYVTRWKTKGGIKDLEKAKHHIALLIEHETAKPSV